MESRLQSAMSFGVMALIASHTSNHSSSAAEAISNLFAITSTRVRPSKVFAMVACSFFLLVSDTV